MGSIAVTNLGKAYKKYPSRRARLADWLLPLEKPRYELHWVLKDINFVINPGEAVGIIGMNGAGKSTLLKMITGTTQPTSGSVHIQGRMAALLELGMGFHPDFTGRQNAFMAGQLLGLTTEEISALMPEIEAFAEIGEYIDQPVRVYSSGMQVRLAFAVATAKRPDILIVDEALSVGDRYFSQKSMGRIRKFLEGGTTLLFVSHDTNAVKTICNKAVLLDKGRMVDFSDPETIIEQYSSSMLARTNNLNLIQNSENKSEKLRREWQKLRFSTQETGDFKEAYAQLDTDEIELLDYRIENSAGELLSIVYTGQVIYVKYRVKAKIPLEDLYFGFSIRDRLSVSVSNTNSFALKCSSISMQQNEVVEVCFKMRLPLQVGFYGLCMGVAQTGYESGEFEKYLLNVHNFEVIEIIRSDTRSSFGGIVNLYPEFILTQSQVDAHY